MTIYRSHPFFSRESQKVQRDSGDVQSCFGDPLPTQLTIYSVVLFGSEGWDTWFRLLPLLNESLCGAPNCQEPYEKGIFVALVHFIIPHFTSTTES